MSRVALFGGSFDPPHNGHIAIVEAIKRLDFIDSIIIMPAFLNPFKTHSFASADLRLEWLREIFKDDDMVEVSSFEVSKNRKVATIESVEHLRSSYDEVFVVIGADNLASLHKWSEYERLSRLASFIVAPRGGVRIPDEFIALDVSSSDSSSEFRASLSPAMLPDVVAGKIYRYYKDRILQNRVEKIVEVLSNNKAESVEVFDIKDREYIADSVVIASSMGQKHTLALLDHLRKELKPAEQFLGSDESENWVVVDLGDILIHIMTPEYRAKYDLESFLSSLANRAN